MGVEGWVVSSLKRQRGVLEGVCAMILGAFFLCEDVRYWEEFRNGQFIILEFINLEGCFFI